MDLVIKTADGKRIGVHRLIVLRVAGFFRELLDACAENEVRFCLTTSCVMCTESRWRFPRVLARQQPLRSHTSHHSRLTNPRVQVTVPETYAVFKARLLDLIYDRAVQIQPAAALQARGAVALHAEPRLHKCRASSSTRIHPAAWLRSASP